MTVLDAIKVELTISREAVLREASQIPDERFTERPAPDVWSASDVLEHLAAIERLVAGMIAKSIEGVSDSDSVPDTDADAIIDSVERLMAERASEPIKSSHVPSHSMNHVDAFDALERTRVQLLHVLDAAHGIDLSRITMPHPVLGEINLYQFLVFVARHEDRHRAQITRLRNQLDPSNCPVS
jgi:uncharacterized damage-inducible protein DinB